MALPVPSNFNMEYIAPSKESIEEDKEDSGNNCEMQGDNHDSDETSVISTSRPVMPQNDSTAIKVEYQTD